MEMMSVVLLVLLAFGPLVLAATWKRRLPLDEPPFKLEGTEITAYPTCLHCGWQGALDVTQFVKSAARMEELTVMKSPPCQKCGRRWAINLTTLIQKYRTGAFA